MGSDRHQALIRGLAFDARPRRLPWPPGARVILWVDAVLLAAAALALGGMPPVLEHGTGAWTWTALTGSTLTAAFAALAAFELSEPGRSRAWTWLPTPALVLWMGASGLGCFAVTDGAEVWGGALGDAAQCLKFLLAISVPLLALTVFMLWRAPSLMRGRVMALGGLASAGAAASLLALVHPHEAPLLDLGVHAVAIAIVLAISAAAARLRPN